MEAPLTVADALRAASAARERLTRVRLHRASTELVSRVHSLLLDQQTSSDLYPWTMGRPVGAQAGPSPEPVSQVVQEMVRDTGWQHEPTNVVGEEVSYWYLPGAGSLPGLQETVEAAAATAWEKKRLVAPPAQGTLRSSLDTAVRKCALAVECVVTDLMTSTDVDHVSIIPDDDGLAVVMAPTDPGVSVRLPFETAAAGSVPWATRSPWFPGFFEVSRKDWESSRAGRVKAVLA